MIKKKIPSLIVPMQDINWKNISLLKMFINRFGNIKPRKYTLQNVKYQKKIRQEIIRARELWLIPISSN